MLIVLLANQQTNSCSYGNVNVTSELHAKSVGLCELTVPTFSETTEQVPLHFIRDLDQYFSLRLIRPTSDIQSNSGTFAKQWLSSSFDRLKSYNELRKHLPNSFGIHVVRPVLGVQSM